MRFFFRRLLQKPSFFVLGCLSIFFAQILLNVFLFGYLELDKMKEVWRGSFTLRAFFADGVTPEKMAEVQKKVSGWSAVREVVFIGADEARRRFLEYFELAEENFPMEENPFPASLEILPWKLEDLPKLALEMKKIGVFDEVLYGGKNVEELLRFHRFFVGVGGIVVFCALLFVFLIIVTLTTLKVRFYQEEIRVLRLMGATSRQIRASFLSEGLFQGFLGGAGALVVSSYFFQIFLAFLQSSFPALFWLQFEELFSLLLLINVLISIILGLVGSFTAVGGILREKT
ncbi:MAG: cell division protein FtsX [Candidatus Caldatribacteriaceae bacterium]